MDVFAAQTFHSVPSDTMIRELKIRISQCCSNLTNNHKQLTYWSRHILHHERSPRTLRYLLETRTTKRRKNHRTSRPLPRLSSPRPLGMLRIPHGPSGGLSLFGLSSRRPSRQMPETEHGEYCDWDGIFYNPDETDGMLFVWDGQSRRISPRHASGL